MVSVLTAHSQIKLGSNTYVVISDVEDMPLFPRFNTMLRTLVSEIRRQMPSRKGTDDKRGLVSDTRTASTPNARSLPPRLKLGQQPAHILRPTGA